LTFTPTHTATATPTVTQTATFTPEPTATDVPTAAPVSVDLSGRWIDVDLTNQMVYAYEGDTIVNSFLVSTGRSRTPTVTGQYRIYVKYTADDMAGPGYFLPDVPYVMYFYRGYGFHGTYWHDNFGTPMSHGCINLRTSDAEWLFHWASVGTLVNIRY
jgi:lipoprotein-anchoring transpeptidase ErfK/SrfK